MASKKKVAKFADNLVLNMKDFVEDLRKKKTSDIFKEPVDEIKHGAIDYYKVITRPMDLSTMMV